MNWIIYTLKNPRTGVVRYVGYTSTGAARRLQTHINEAVERPRGTRKNRWLLSLLSIGLSPTIEVVETGTGLGWDAAEKRWIAAYLEQGAQLVNHRDGGAGYVPGSPALQPAKDRRFTHGLSGTVEHTVWMAMTQRSKGGAKVCSEWREDFLAFLRDVGQRPSPDHWLIRFPNPAGNYKPGNVRWALPKEERRNRKTALKIEHKGEIRPLAEICEELNIKYVRVEGRRLKGWPQGKLFDAPRPQGSATMCIRGHLFEGNVYVNSRGARQCRTCVLDRATRAYAMKKLSATAQRA